MNTENKKPLLSKWAKRAIGALAVGGVVYYAAKRNVGGLGDKIAAANGYVKEAAAAASDVAANAASAAGQMAQGVAKVAREGAKQVGEVKIQR